MKTVTNIQNIIKRYEDNAENVKKIISGFDFTTACRILAPLQPIFAYRALKTVGANPVNNLQVYERLAASLSKMSNIFFGESFQKSLENLEDAVEFSKTVAGNETFVKTWVPSRDTISICESVLNPSRDICFVGQEFFNQTINDYLSECFGRWLPNATENEVREMIQKGYVTEKLLDSYVQRGFATISELSAVYAALGVETPDTFVYTDLKIKGTTYNTNKDGSSRQEHLARIAQSNGQAEITLKGYTYTPKNGQPEPAVAVMCNGVDIGNIGADVVKQIYAVVKDPSFKVTSYQTTGGYNSSASYGLKISFEVTGHKITQQEETTEESFNPLNI